MDIETKMAKIHSFAAEIITEDELKTMFENNSHPIAYDGFEPSGLAPIHFGLLRAKNLKIMMETGIHFKLYLADYFAFINNKLEGDLDHIRTAGRYFVEVWKGCGIDTSKVEIIWAKDLMNGIEYWDRFMKVGKATTLDRVKRAITIMGRTEGDKLSAAQLYYPGMQVTDIFQMDVDLCQLGMDQRRANILAREVSDKYKWKKPVAAHHSMVLGLQGVPKDLNLKENPERIIEFKMSKSNPKSAIYVHDSYEQIKAKIATAYCPEKIIDGNPMFNYLKLMILENAQQNIVIERPQKFGGDIAIDGYDQLVKIYEEGKVHPMDIKNFVANELEKQIKPIREHFENNSAAKKIYEEVKEYTITR